MFHLWIVWEHRRTDPSEQQQVSQTSSILPWQHQQELLAKMLTMWQLCSRQKKNEFASSIPDLIMLEPVVPEQYRHRSNSCSGCSVTPILPHRPPALGGRSPQSSFESNGDVGQISLNWMRMNGTIAPFKTLLKSSDSNTPPPQKTSHTVNDSICRVSSYNRIIGLNSSQPLVVTEIVKDRESTNRDTSEEKTFRITVDDVSSRFPNIGVSIFAILSSKRTVNKLESENKPNSTTAARDKLKADLCQRVSFEVVDEEDGPKLDDKLDMQKHPPHAHSNARGPNNAVDVVVSTDDDRDGRSRPIATLVLDGSDSSSVRRTSYASNAEFYLDSSLYQSPKTLRPISRESSPTDQVVSFTREFSIKRRPPTSLMRKQDSIAEEPPLITDSLESPQFDSPSVVAPQSHFLDDCRNRTTPSPLAISPEFGSRKGSLSPKNLNGFSSQGNIYSGVVARRKVFTRAVSAAQSDVTETVSKEMASGISEPASASCISCENTMRIKFDISPSSGSLPLNKNSSSSSILYRYPAVPPNAVKKRLPSSISSIGGGSLVANGFLPSSNLLSTSTTYSNGRDPARWHLAITKQRSHSESAFNMSNIHHHHGSSCSGVNHTLCPEHRRCSVSILNPAREQAILRRILGPQGLEWLSREHLSKKSISNAPSDDLEAHRFNNDHSKTPLMKEKEKGGRLIKRQQLYEVRRATCDYALIFSIIGIVLMIVENELSAARVYEKNSLWSVMLKSTILLSTLILIGLVIKFHIHEVQLFMNANAAEDWRIAFTFRRCLQIGAEVFVCGVCPLPFDINFRWNVVSSDGEHFSTTLVPLDVVLSIPMFLRIYWCARCMLLHSRLFTDASSRSIAGLNRVNFNARFILKTLMTLCPGTMLMVFTFCCWLIAGWIMRLCERHHFGDESIHGNIHGVKHQNYLNSLWLIAITFLSVGYGDIVPYTYCGRAMAVITGILGTCTSSMVVAVIARKLELTRAEKHVHNFMMDTQLTKKLKHSAANVIREMWLIYKFRHLVVKVDHSKVRHHQRQFLVAIYELRKVKRDQRKLAENSVSLGDVAKTTSNSYELIHDIHSTQEGLALRMTAVEHQLSDIQRELSTITEFLKASIKLPSVVEQASQEENGNHDSVRRRRHAMEMSN